MTERPASRQFGKAAQKWRVLAEKRRAHFTELYRSGRWQLYYTEDELLERMREVVSIAERWGQIAPPEPVAVQAPAPVAAERPARNTRRNAA